MTIFAELRAGVVSSSAEETRRLAARLAAALPPDATLALHGDLGRRQDNVRPGPGSGLLPFGPGHQPDLQHSAPVSRGARRAPIGRQDPLRRDPGERGFNLVHLDAYRIENAHRVAELMLDDFLVSPYCLAVEWPKSRPGCRRVRCTSRSASRRPAGIASCWPDPDSCTIVGRRLSSGRFPSELPARRQAPALQPEPISSWGRERGYGSSAWSQLSTRRAK